MGCEALSPDLDIIGMLNTDFAELVVSYSPKMQAILALYMDWCLLRNKKVIFWFITSVV